MHRICGKSPESGAQVFVFFEAGDINKPVYFASAQSGPGWFAEHPNQHVFQTDNIRVRIDEEPAHPDSTCKFNTYNDENSDPSKEDGTKLERQTRLDIEVLAKDINAVNVQIHGDVNMKIDGDWYVHHEGNKHETHIGNTYIKHIGDTYKEEEGITIFKHTGDYSQVIDGTYTENITVNYNQTIGADSFIDITNRSNLNIGGDYTKTVGGSLKYNIVGGENKSIGTAQTIRVGENSAITIAGSKTLIIGDKYTINANEDIEQISKYGNISITTQGEFEIVDGSGNITAEGYANLGTRGNITITSTFGNIGINTIENKALADLETETCVIPWNPSYLKSLALISQFVPGFDPHMTVTTPDLNFTDLTSFLKFLQTAVLYDGFPTFLPCKMIMQNPSIEPPETSSMWITEFSGIDDDWVKITNTKYWKLISKVVGNIDIKSWSGDINIKTDGTLGNAGNINLFANNKYGALPGYKVGNVQVTADTPFRVFTDPRDLFLDTHLYGKLFGKFAWFSNATGQPQQLMPPPITIKPLQPVQQLLQMLGVPFEFGFIQENSNGGGCMKCITDVITQVAVDLGLFSIVPYVITEKVFLEEPTPHKFNAGAKSLIHEDLPGGSVSILNRISNGYGHAVDEFGLDQIYGSKDYPFGNIIINGVGSYDLHVGKNATFAADTNNWNFGVSANIDTGWFYPSKGINPIDNILGEMNIAIPGQVGQPVIKTRETIYYNSYDKKIFGEYHSIYNGMVDMGVYSIPQVKMGVMGDDTSEYVVKVPFKFEETKEFKQCNSNEFDVSLQPFTIPASVHSSNIEYTTTNINGLADDNINDDESIPEGDDIDSDTDNTSEDTNSSSTSTNANSNKTGKNNKAKDPDADIMSSFKMQYGNEYWSTCTSGCVVMSKIKKKMPNTANAISTVISILGAIIKLIPALGTVIGEFIQQAAKAFPNLRLMSKTDFYSHMDYAWHIQDTKDMSINIPYQSHSKFGIIAWPISSAIMSGKPLVYNYIDMGFPDILPVADSLLSVGTAIDPMGCLQKLITEKLPEVVESTELNTTVGIGGLPKFLSNIIFGAEELVSANVGLFKGAKFGLTINALDSEQDKKLHFTKIEAQLPVPPEIDLSVLGESYTMKCGWKATADIWPIPDGTFTMDIWDETLAWTVGGPLIPHTKLVIGGKELWNIPNGGAGILGSGLIDAIVNMFF